MEQKKNQEVIQSLKHELENIQLINKQQTN